jgi:multicomponent Na+:H+ antiporter subunit E
MQKKKGVLAIFVLTLVMTGIWYLLSGKLDLLHLGTGVAAALIISLNLRHSGDVTRFRPGQFLLYVPWLIGQVFISNLRVARLVLTPRMPIAPSFLAQRPGVRGPRALTTLGCSITLTPGTLTVDVGEDEIFVHALEGASARDVREGIMARRVSAVFPEQAP